MHTRLHKQPSFNNPTSFPFHASTPSASLLFIPLCRQKRPNETNRASPIHIHNLRPYITHHDNQSSPKLDRTHLRQRLRNSLVSSRHSRAASTFAGLSSLGLLSMLMTERMMVSGVWTGDQRSAADS